MKNIHIIPTDKPSRLYKSKITQDVFISDNRSQHGDATYNVNIYITSDEEIKEGKWCYNSINNNIYKKEIDKLRFAYEYKIILTTDQDLINNGVQEIDNDFLEWFIKNPSCEEVEIRKEMYIPQSNGKISDGKITHEISLDSSQNTLPYYKLIIPKESKQKTLEKLAKEYYPDELKMMEMMERIAFKRGYTECEERMYSEEEVLEILLKHQSDYRSTVRNTSPLNWSFDIKDWFEQFKKK